MPYNINYTDPNKQEAITVYDNTTNEDTSLRFPGRNVTGYGKIIAENFLNLLENFAGPNRPVNPVEGQIWYDNSAGQKELYIYDGTNWKSASTIQKGTTEPRVEDSSIGELWVDTTNQQLYVFSGQNWILVGPNFSTGLRSGPVIESVVDADNVDRVILTVYVQDEPVIIISKDSFTPKTTVRGFTRIRSGINITEITDIGVGGFAPKLYGTATIAESLSVGGTPIEASKFFILDRPNTTTSPINIRNNGGLSVGSDGTLNFTTTTTSAQIYNKTAGSSIDIQTNRGGSPATIFRVVNNTVGINKDVPDESLDVSGNIKTDGILFTTNTSETTNLNNGSIRTAGGLAVTKNVIVGQTLEVRGTTTTNAVIPSINEAFDLGSDSDIGGRRWNTVYAKTIKADNIVGPLQGNLIGNATTATNLRSRTTFTITGDITTVSGVEFDGQFGGSQKVFNTRLTSGIINNQVSVTSSQKEDQMLIYRPSIATAANPGLLKIERDAFIGDAGVPIGTILPFAGITAPAGYLLCDGGEVEQAKYPDLYTVIGDTYSTVDILAGGLVVGITYTIVELGDTNWTAASGGSLLSPEVGDSFTAATDGNSFVPGGVIRGRARTVTLTGLSTFRLPDLRGRFALGKDNMNNNNLIPISGGFADAGGGNADRVGGLEADNVGGVSGSSTQTLDISNLPDHEHTMTGASGNQYYAVNVSTSSPTDGGGAFLGRGPVTPGQMQYLPTSGFVKPPSGTILGSSFSIMPPFITLNYIIRSGPPEF
jgi:microcystin-dependent protein